MSTGQRATVQVNRREELYGRDVIEKWFIRYSARSVAVTLEVVDAGDGELVHKATELGLDDIPEDVAVAGVNYLGSAGDALGGAR
jgi:CO/xanthine dehydrogenase Mo-binding subunit